MHPLPTDALQSFEEDLLPHALHLYEHVVQHDLRLVPLEVVLLRTALVGAQDVDLRVFPQPLHRVAVLRVEVAQVVEGELAGGPALEGVDRYPIIFVGLLVVLGVGLLGVVIGVAFEVVVHGLAGH